MKISVVVPVLNNAASVRRCFDSIIAQPHPDIELIVVDGGSVDGTLDVIKQYEGRISYWESGQDTGISDAFNRGISRATGELVAILNSDDCWLPGAIEQVLLTHAIAPDADVFYGQIRYVDEQTGNRYIRKPDLSRIKERMYLFHPALFVSKSSYERIGGYSEEYSLAMDSEWCHRALAAHLKFQEIEQPLADMYLGGRSDVGYVAAQNEYRKSLLKHRLAGWLTANYHFIRVVFFKTLMRIYPLRVIKQMLFR